MNAEPFTFPVFTHITDGRQCASVGDTRSLARQIGVDSLKEVIQYTPDPTWDDVYQCVFESVDSYYVYTIDSATIYRYMDREDFTFTAMSEARDQWEEYKDHHEDI